MLNLPHRVLAVTTHVFPDVKCIRHGFARQDMTNRAISFARKLTVRGIRLEPPIIVEELGSEDILSDYSAMLFQES